jgi:hypothetical protein
MAESYTPRLAVQKTRAAYLCEPTCGKWARPVFFYSLSLLLFPTGISLFLRSFVRHRAAPVGFLCGLFVSFFDFLSQFFIFYFLFSVFLWNSFLVYALLFCFYI